MEYSRLSSVPASPTSAPTARSWLHTINNVPDFIQRKFFSDGKSKTTIIRVIQLAMVGILVVAVFYVLRATKLNRPLIMAMGIVDKKDLVDESIAERNHNRAKYLMRESARLIASAIEKRGNNPLEAYENAAQAAVLARTAKEIEDNVSKLSDELGVDFHEYLSYTSTVLQGLRAKLRAG